MKKRKQKSVTMWAIWSPYSNSIMLNTAAHLRKDSYKILFGIISKFERETGFTKRGYRAVKGKFVWEEK